MNDALDRYREERRTQMHADVTRALRDLDRAGKPINMSRVASEAGVSRQWLYDSPFRDEIERLRQRPTRDALKARPIGEASSEASLRAQNEALRQRLKEVREENAELREELARALGLLRASPRRRY
ncbi:DUF6262 family protein [Streptomyces sp. AcE210]|uniref:DUF6262 family protein n=1 Tax=Streptomyces sp. AcE210 TaxID=2292703 RepID=UPI000E3001F3|nr:DUF6262 family protein [Streptomyces sp. AcE210]RFC71073.1 transposase [Streptomyces sp. AcE210]